MENNNSGDFKKFGKEAIKIKELRLQRNDKMQILQEKGYEEKELKNVLKEKSKLEVLGVFENSKNSRTFHKETRGNRLYELTLQKKRNERLYKEVRYACVTSQTLPPTSALFCHRARGNKYLQLGEYAQNLAVSG